MHSLCKPFILNGPFGLQNEQFFVEVEQKLEWIICKQQFSFDKCISLMETGLKILLKYDIVRAYFFTNEPLCSWTLFSSKLDWGLSANLILIKKSV